MKADRNDRVNAELKREIASCLQNDVKNPEITEFWTVLDVKCDKLFIGAQVYLSIFSTDKAKKRKTFDAICRVEPFIRHCLSQKMHLRKMPKFNFVLDDTEEKGEKIDKLINEIHKNDN